MTTTTLIPNSTIKPATVVGGGTAHGAVTDGSDATYLSFTSTSNTAVLGMQTKTLAAGEITKSIQISARSSGASFSVRPGQSVLPLSTSSAFPARATVGLHTAAEIPFTQSQAFLNNLSLSFSWRSSGGYSNAFVADLSAALVTVAKPVTTITAVSPDPYTASTVVPVSWANTLDSDGGAQTRYQLIVTDDNDGNAVVFDSGSVVSAATSSTVGPLGNGDYTVKVRVGQTVIGATHWSSYSSNSFAVDVVTSDVATVSAVADDANARIAVTVTRDGVSQAWDLVEVERSIDGGLAWSPVRTATLVDATGDADEFAVTDYEVANGQTVKYRARATYYSSGLPITGPWTESSTESWSSTDHWLKSPLSPSLNVRIECDDVTLNNIGALTRDRPAGMFQPVGREETVVVADVRSLGGSSINIETKGRAALLALDAILKADTVLLLNLHPDSLIGPNRDGFQYVSVGGTTENTVTAYMSEFRSISLPYVNAERPPDATAGAL